MRGIQLCQVFCYFGGNFLHGVEVVPKVLVKLVGVFMFFTIFMIMMTVLVVFGEMIIFAVS